MPHRPLISIVDDDLSVRRALRRLVQSASYAVDTFASAREFLDASPFARPACLVLDLCLGGMSGLELQALLSAQGDGVPIVFVSAMDDPTARKRAMDAGAVAFIDKPFEEARLLEVLRAITRYPSS